MSVGIGQILVILFIVVLLFGKLPNLTEDLSKGIQQLRSLLHANKEQHKIDDSKTKEIGKPLDKKDL